MTDKLTIVLGFPSSDRKAAEQSAQDFIKAVEELYRWSASIASPESAGS
jgi:hypothetical protein